MSNVELTKQIYATFGAGDVDSLVAKYWHPEIEWVEPAGVVYGGTFRGADEILQNVFPKIGEQWGENFSATPEEFLDAGDAVVVLGTESGTKDGEEYSVPFCHVLKFRDGKCSYYQQFTDTASVPGALAAVTTR